MELILVRCGKTQAPPGTLRGQAQLALAATGFADLQQLASSWIGPPPRFLFSSDLRRSRESVQVFAAALGMEPLIDARLRELDLGLWNGANFAKISVQETQAWQRWNADCSEYAPPEGELWGALLERTRSWLDGLRQLQSEQRVLAIVHEGSLRAILAHILDLPLAKTRTLRIMPAHASALRLQPDGDEVSYLNSPQFLVL